MITCVLRYQIEPQKISAFEDYAIRWISLVERFGGTHHGYFLPHEGASDVAIALFSFPSLAAYETYRANSLDDDECLEAYAVAAMNGCIRRYDRTFMRPLGTSIDNLIGNVGEEAVSPAP